MFLFHKFQVSDVAIHGILPGRSCCIPLVKRQPGGLSWIYFVRVRYNPKTTGTTFISILGLIYSLVKQHNYGKHDYFKRYIIFFNGQYSIAVLVYQDGNHILFFWGLAIIFLFTNSRDSLKLATWLMQTTLILF